MTENILAGTVIRDNNGHYLLVQESNAPKAYGLWSFPGGHIDPGETIEQAAIRETKEEVGYSVRLMDNRPILSQRTILNKQHIYKAFRAEIIGGKLKPDYDDLLGAKWLSLEKIKELSRQKLLRDPLILSAILKAENLAVLQ